MTGGPPVRAALAVARETWRGWKRHGTERLAAALAFFAMFSIAPMLMLITAILGWIFGRRAVRGELEASLVELVGPELATTIHDIVESSHDPSAQALTALVGFGTLAWAATRTITQLQGALDTIWDVAPNRVGGLAALIRQRAVAFSLVLGLGLVLMTSLALSTAARTWTHHLAAQITTPEWLVHTIDNGLSAALLGLAFAVLFRVLPSRREAWRPVLYGGLVTGLLFTAGKHGISLYLSRTGTASAYGAAGSVVALLLWLYYTAMIVLVGAEITQVLARRWSRAAGVSGDGHPRPAEDQT